MNDRAFLDLSIKKLCILKSEGFENLVEEGVDLVCRLGNPLND